MKLKLTIFFICTAITFAILSLIPGCTQKNLGGSLHSLPDVVDFNFHIKPILSDRCFVRICI